MQTEANSATVQAYHGYDIQNRFFINLAAMELLSAYSNIDKPSLYPHVAFIGTVGWKVLDQRAFVIFFCREEGEWFALDFPELKEYWTSEKFRLASVNDLQEAGLVYHIRITAHGPDYLGLIKQPFTIVRKENEGPFGETYL